MSDIHTKLAAVAGAIGPINKDERNKEQGFNFRSIEQITDRARPLLAAQGISTGTEVLSIEHTEVVSRSQAKGWRCLVVMRYTFSCEDDSKVVVEMPGEAIDYGDKSTSKAAQMAYKYALTQALTIGSGEADPDSQSPDVAEVVWGAGRSQVRETQPQQAPVMRGVDGYVTKPAEGRPMGELVKNEMVVFHMKQDGVPNWRDATNEQRQALTEKAKATLAVALDTLGIDNPNGQLSLTEDQAQQIFALVKGEAP